MANEDRIGGIKNYNTVTSGMDGADIASKAVPMPNNFYNTFRTSQTSESTRFLQYTMQHAKVAAQATIANFDFTFGSTSGVNPYQKLDSHQGKNLHAIG